MTLEEQLEQLIDTIDIILEQETLDRQMYANLSHFRYKSKNVLSTIENNGGLKRRKYVITMDGDDHKSYHYHDEVINELGLSATQVQKVLGMDVGDWEPFTEHVEFVPTGETFVIERLQ